MSLVALNTTWITHPFSQLSFLSQSILFLLSALVLLLLTSAALKPLSRALTPKPFGFIPHLNGQRMILGDAARLMKFIGEKDCHTAWFESIVRELGNPPLCEVVLGLRAGDHTVIVNDVAEAEDILLRRTTEFDRSDLTLALFSCVAPTAQIATATDTMWKHHRRVMGPTMTSSSIKRFAPRASRTMRKMIDLWKLKYDQGMFDPKMDLEFATTDAITEITFGESLGCLDSALVTAQEAVVKNPSGLTTYDYKPPQIFTSMGWLFETVSIRSVFPRFEHFFREMTPTYKKHISVVDGWIYQKLKEGRAACSLRGTDAQNMVDCVLDLICLKDNSPDRLTDQEIRDELIQYCIAGQDTAATSLLWGVKYFARNPSVQRKLHDEIVDMDLDRDPIYDDVVNMPYLEAVTWEVLRLSMAAPATNRKALTDVKVMGHIFPKGTTFAFPIRKYSQQPNPRNDWSEKDRSAASLESAVKEWDPETTENFDPERWLNSDGSFNAKAGPAMPFGLGQRGCFGKSLAILEMKLFLFHMIGSFFFEPVPEDMDSFRDKENVTCKPAQCYIKIKPWEEVSLL